MQFFIIPGMCSYTIVSTEKPLLRSSLFLNLGYFLTILFVRRNYLLSCINDKIYSDAGLSWNAPRQLRLAPCHSTCTDEKILLMNFFWMLPTKMNILFKINDRFYYNGSLHDSSEHDIILKCLWCTGHCILPPCKNPLLLLTIQLWWYCSISYNDEHKSYLSRQLQCALYHSVDKLVNIFDHCYNIAFMKSVVFHLPWYF